MTAVVLVSVAALSGCTGSSAPGPTPSETTTSPSPSPSLTATQHLQQLATLGTKVTFAATYRVHQQHPASSATWRVWRRSGSLRVDVVTKRATATLIRTPRHTFACTRSGHKKRCFRVSDGSALPAPLRLLAAQLFSANVASMARASGISVKSATTSGRFGDCFTVAPEGHKATVEKADYCFNAAGILTRVTYPNGNFVRAEHVTTRKPSNTVFRPYASPTPIPR